jgi:hypothetical protein
MTSGEACYPDWLRFGTAHSLSFVGHHARPDAAQKLNALADRISVERSSGAVTNSGKQWSISSIDTTSCRRAVTAAGCLAAWGRAGFGQQLL